MNRRWRRWFAWSKSRAEVFRGCPKRYSFQYLFKFEAGPAARMAKALSKLPSLAMKKGTLVHEELERWVKLRPDARDREASHQRLDRAFRLLEGAEVAPLLERVFGTWSKDECDQKVAEARQDAAAQLDRFHQDLWPGYAPLEVLACEELERTPVGEHQAWVSADLVLRDEDGRVRVVDWKTGRRGRPADESEQLTAYIHWAAQRFGVPLDQVDAELVWLATGEVDRTARTAEDLAALEQVVARDCEAMLALESYDQIQAAPSESGCRRCAFRPLCRDDLDPMPEDAKRAAKQWAMEA